MVPFESIMSASCYEAPSLTEQRYIQTVKQTDGQTKIITMSKADLILRAEALASVGQNCEICFSLCLLLSVLRSMLPHRWQ